MDNYDKGSLEQIAEKMGLSGNGTRIKIASRIVRGFKIWLTDEMYDETYLRLYRNAETKKLKKTCIRIGISPEGRKREIFDRLARSFPELSERL